MKRITEETIKRMIEEGKPYFDQKKYWINLNDEPVGTLLKYYIFLTEYPDAVFRRIPGLGKDDLLYNRYYWYLKYYTQYKTDNGPDPGMEDEAFMLLEEIDQVLEGDVEWDVVKQIRDEIDPGLDEQ